MAFLLRLLLAFLQALPLIVSAYSMGVSNANSGEEGLASSIAGLSVTPLNLLIYGGITVFVIGQVSGWSLKGFFGWIRGIASSIAKAWADSAAPAPNPTPVVARPANAPATVTLPYVVPATPTPPTP